MGGVFGAKWPRPHGDMGLSDCGEKESGFVNPLLTGGEMAVGWASAHRSRDGGLKPTLPDAANDAAHRLNWIAGTSPAMTTGGSVMPVGWVKPTVARRWVSPTLPVKTDDGVPKRRRHPGESRDLPQSSRHLNEIPAFAGMTA